MEGILRKRELKLIKEGLFFIDSFEEYTSKNNPDIYKIYLSLKEEKLISLSDKWSKNMKILNDVKNEIWSRFYSFIDHYDDMFEDMEKYINTFKPRVFLERENLNEIYDTVCTINQISELPNKSRFIYIKKCIIFLNIKDSLLLKIKMLEY